MNVNENKQIELAQTLAESHLLAIEMSPNKYVCAWDGCTAHRKPGSKSKYCQVHRSLARKHWATKIDEERDLREERYAGFQLAIKRAASEAEAAFKRCKPTPMYIQGYDPIDDGVCGFASLRITPGNCSFAHYLKKRGMGYKAYRGGWSISSHEFLPNDQTQSYERKKAAMAAAALVLREEIGALDPKAKIWVEAQLD